MGRGAEHVREESQEVERVRPAAWAALEIDRLVRLLVEPESGLDRRRRSRADAAVAVAAVQSTATKRAAARRGLVSPTSPSRLPRTASSPRTTSSAAARRRPPDVVAGAECVDGGGVERHRETLVAGDARVHVNCRRMADQDGARDQIVGGATVAVAEAAAPHGSRERDAAPVGRIPGAGGAAVVDDGDRAASESRGRHHDAIEPPAT